MKRLAILIILTGLALATATTDAVAQKKHKIKPSVAYAQSWDAAQAEAKLLNVPMVVHSHGFY